MGIGSAMNVCLPLQQSRKPMNEMRNLGINMRYAGKKTAICDHFCPKRVRKTQFFYWSTYLGGEFIKTMCITCALREMWGYNYKQSKHYKKWVEK